MRSPGNENQTVERPSKDQHVSYVKLPKYALVYFDELIGEFESIQDRTSPDTEAASPDSQAVTQIRHLRHRYEQNPKLMTWGDLCALDRLLLRLRNTDELRERIVVLQSRYLDIAVPSEYSKYLKSKESELAKAQKEELLGRIDVLVAELYRHYMVAACREKLRHKAVEHLNWAIVAAFAIFLIALGVYAYFYAVRATELNRLPTMAAILFAGSLGGFVSAQQRVRKMPRRGGSIMDLIALSPSGPPHSVAPAVGAVFALILYMLFVSQIITGTLFPAITTVSTLSTFVQFISNTGPTAGVDWAKLLVWSFIAGFAERLVPDTLHTLAAHEASEAISDKR